MYKADSEPEILYVTTCTTHFIQMIVLFSLKKKKFAKLGHLIQSAGTGAFGPKALCILHLLGGCPILKGIKHSSLQLSPWHEATVQTGMQKPKPENKRRLTAQSTELGRNCQDQ